MSARCEGRRRNYPRTCQSDFGCRRGSGGTMHDIDMNMIGVERSNWRVMWRMANNIACPIDIQIKVIGSELS